MSVKIDKDLVAASARPLVLTLLSRGESYGYELLQNIRTYSAEQLMWSEGMLYPVLHRLEREGLIASAWKVSDAGRRRKYYRLCDAGKAEMARQKHNWLAVHKTLVGLWEGELCLT